MIVCIYLACFQVLWGDGSPSSVSSDHQQLRTDALQPHLSTPDHDGESQRARGGLTILCPPYAVSYSDCEHRELLGQWWSITFDVFLCRNLTALLIYQTQASAPTRDTTPSERNTSVDWIRDVSRTTQNTSMKISDFKHFCCIIIIIIFNVLDRTFFTVFIIFNSQ